MDSFKAYFANTVSGSGGGGGGGGGGELFFGNDCPTGAESFLSAGGPTIPSSESDNQYQMLSARTITKFKIHVGNNTGDGETNLFLRINGGDVVGSQIDVPALTGGNYSVVVDQAYVEDDLISVRVNANSLAGAHSFNASVG